jgi:hypothetical protein
MVLQTRLAKRVVVVGELRWIHLLVLVLRNEIPNGLMGRKNLKNQMMCGLLVGLILREYGVSRFIVSREPYESDGLIEVRKS